MTYINKPIRPFEPENRTLDLTQIMSVYTSSSSCGGRGSFASYPCKEVVVTCFGNNDTKSCATAIVKNGESEHTAVFTTKPNDIRIMRLPSNYTAKFYQGADPAQYRPPQVWNAPRENPQTSLACFTNCMDTMPLGPGPQWCVAACGLPPGYGPDFCKQA